MTARITEIAALEKCTVTEDGLAALLTLSEGDMRRILNIMQACFMAFPTVDQDSVYNCTGKPHPDDISVRRRRMSALWSVRTRSNIF